MSWQRITNEWSRRTTTRLKRTVPQLNVRGCKTLLNSEYEATRIRISPCKLNLVIAQRNLKSFSKYCTLKYSLHRYKCKATTIFEMHFKVHATGVNSQHFFYFTCTYYQIMQQPFLRNYVLCFSYVAIYFSQVAFCNSLFHSLFKSCIYSNISQHKQVKFDVYYLQLSSNLKLDLRKFHPRKIGSGKDRSSGHSRSISC